MRRLFENMFKFSSSLSKYSRTSVNEQNSFQNVTRNSKHRVKKHFFTRIYKKCGYKCSKECFRNLGIIILLFKSKLQTLDKSFYE